MSSLLFISSGLFVLGMLVVGIIYPIYKKKFIKQKETELENETEREEEKDVERVAIDAFIAEHPNVSEVYLKNLVNRYICQIIIKKPLFRCSEEVCLKMARDENLEILRKMRIVETKILSYNDKILKADLIFTNYQEEYKVNAVFEVSVNDLMLQSYNIYKKTNGTLRV